MVDRSRTNTFNPDRRLYWVPVRTSQSARLMAERATAAASVSAGLAARLSSAPPFRSLDRRN